MSNERTLLKSQGAGGGRSGHREAQLPGGQPWTEEGKAVKGAGPAREAATGRARWLGQGGVH